MEPIISCYLVRLRLSNSIRHLSGGQVSTGASCFGLVIETMGDYVGQKDLIRRPGFGLGVPIGIGMG